MNILAGWIAVARGKRIVWLMWAFTLLFAAAVAAPVSALLGINLGHSLLAARMLDNFDPQWFAEFGYASRGWPLAMVPPAAALLALGFALLAVFITGGALAVYVSGEGYGSSTFWTGCGRYFWRLLRLLVLLLLASVLVFLFSGVIGSIGRKIWGDGMEEHPLVIFGWVRAAITVLLLLGVGMIFDYARIGLVADERRSAFRSLLTASRFVARNPGPAVATYALLCVAAVGVAAAYWVLSAVLPRHALGWLALVFLVQQAFIFARCWVKLWFLASQTELYMALRPAAPVAEPLVACRLPCGAGPWPAAGSQPASAAPEPPAPAPELSA